MHIVFLGSSSPAFLSPDSSRRSLRMVSISPLLVYSAIRMRKLHSIHNTTSPQILNTAGRNSDSWINEAGHMGLQDLKSIKPLSFPFIEQPVSLPPPTASTSLQRLDMGNCGVLRTRAVFKRFDVDWASLPPWYHGQAAFNASVIPVDIGLMASHVSMSFVKGKPTREK